MADFCNFELQYTDLHSQFRSVNCMTFNKKTKQFGVKQTRVGGSKKQKWRNGERQTQ